MTFPNIPNISPLISITTRQTIPLLLASIALEELALAHIMNAEAEKVQLVLGTLTPTSTTFSPATVSLSNLFALDASVQRTLRDVIMKKMLLEFKFENVLDLTLTIPTTPPGVPSLQIIKNVSDTIITTGSNLTFFITVASTGTVPLTNLTVTDTLPASTTLISTNAPPGFNVMFAAGTVTFVSLNPIPPAGTVSFQIVVNVNAPACTTINNTASASADGVAPVTTPPTVTIVV